MIRYLPLKLRLALACLPLLAAGGATAAGETYGQVLPERSTLTFVSKQMGVAVDGRFRQFATTLAFDPARPAQGSARFELDMASIDAGSKDANDEVVGKAWFDVRTHPRATFVSSSVKALGGDRYEVAGTLTIKGRALPVTAPFTFRQEGGNAVFAGHFPLRRLDFGIGEGLWSDTSVVANDVQIRFHIVAAPRK
jgi:polyisoprenoid-binding protein YceI